jgi:pimeloyl-ACP methyl ester carboxylesterase
MIVRSLQLNSQPATIALPETRAGCRLLVICKGGGFPWAYSTNILEAPERWQEAMHFLTQRNFAILNYQCYDASLPDGGVQGAGHTWGNDVSTTALNAAVTAAIAATPEIKGSKIALMGLSMGNTTMLNYWRRFPANVRGLLGIIPAPSLAWFRGTDASPSALGGYGVINNAYAATFGPAPMTDAKFVNVYATSETTTIAPSITVPYGLWSNSDDPQCPPAQVDLLAAAVPPSLVTRLDMGTGGHHLNNVRANTIADFFQSLPW